MLEPLGYEVVGLASGASDEAGLLTNVTVSARRPAAAGPPQAEQVSAATAILQRSLNGSSPSELATLAEWEKRLRSLLADATPHAT